MNTPFAEPPKSGSRIVYIRAVQTARVTRTLNLHER